MIFFSFFEIYLSCFEILCYNKVKSEADRISKGARIYEDRNLRYARKLGRDQKMRL